MFTHEEIEAQYEKLRAAGRKGLTGELLYFKRGLMDSPAVKKVIFEERAWFKRYLENAGINPLTVYHYMTSRIQQSFLSYRAELFHSGLLPDCYVDLMEHENDVLRDDLVEFECVALSVADRIFRFKSRGEGQCLSSGVFTFRKLKVINTRTLHTVSIS